MWAPGMYNAYFGFKEIPFNTLSNPDEFFFSQNARNSENALLRAIRNPCGVMFLWGDPGVGKSTLLRKLAHELSQTHQFIFPAREGPRIEPVLDCLARLYDLDPVHRSYAQKLEMLGRKFATYQRITANTVLIVEDAHELPAAAIGDLLVVLQDRAQVFPVVQLLFAGSPALKSRTYRSLLDRIGRVKTYWRRLEGLTDEEVRRFIDKRLEIAGYHGKPLFTDQAIHRIIEYSEGNIGKVSVLCGFSLLSASLENRRVVTEEIVEEEALHCLLNQQQLPDNTTIPLGKEYTGPIEPDGFDCGLIKADIAQRYEELGIPRPDQESAEPPVQTLPDDGCFVAHLREWTTRFSTNAAKHGGVILLTIVLISMLVGDGDSNYPNALSENPEAGLDQRLGTADGVATRHNPAATPLNRSKYSAVSADIKIQEMLFKAQEQLAAQRMIAPAGDNALDTYKEIALLIDRQVQTLDGMVQIKRMYQRLGFEAEFQGDWATAEKFYTNAYRLSPYDNLLESAIERVRNEQIVTDSSGVGIGTGFRDSLKLQIKADHPLWTERDSSFAVTENFGPHGK